MVKIYFINIKKHLYYKLNVRTLMYVYIGCDNQTIYYIVTNIN